MHERKPYAMKILAINTSPDKDGGNVSMILEPFVEGMKEAGANVEVFNIAGMQIQPCRECTDDLFYVSNGKCACKDDMQTLYPKFQEADIWVLASPSYCNKMEPKLKTLLDRMEPLFQPIDPDLGPNNNNEKRKIAFVSTCEQYEIESFRKLEKELKMTGDLYSRDFAGSLLRPHSGVMNAFMQMNDNLDDIFDAAKEAGRQLVKKGKIKTDTKRKVGRKLLSKKSFILKLNEIADNE